MSGSKWAIKVSFDSLGNALKDDGVFRTYLIEHEQFYALVMYGVDDWVCTPIHSACRLSFYQELPRELPKAKCIACDTLDIMCRQVKSVQSLARLLNAAEASLGSLFQVANSELIKIVAK